MNSTIRQFVAAITLTVAIPTAPVSSAPVILSQQFSRQWASSAVDTKGGRHQASDYPKGHVPWIQDEVKTVKPDYPYTERAHRIGGFGLYRVTLDLKTGSVTKVTVIQSTGVPVLDDNAKKALRQWLWKPGKWKEINVPIAFLPQFR
jgi:TonB family protein